ncbi:hormogonium polysaccharide biosynthesis glycosyltransferase HpsE [Lyngbya sp. CCY1209]|uniref:hormogonium polysaccharide biosynthesis glycosyltransferase HpsE n=1 Tax=Lyngbya sp. CCY1209 TaxID=2886103 RepID=UPI002D2165DB|nr:hormogonium polysaccharide biosynthesis glycosyltransferase HpsE [Lyngbya sp. CCY1209]MEB3886606.1 hormogonium polysaccharide biosynthesis glycosyltransferase HpsE [Lyngbya sp. CCY1209]
MLDLTVVICTYNGASRLPNVLERLLTQEKTENLSWEIIVVDNNSTDQTAEIIRKYQARFSEIVPLKYCFEPRQGLAYARRRAIREVPGELIGFLDDDNYPDPNWVAAACDFGKKHPQAGGYGGRILGKYDEQPPKNFERIASLLAVSDRGTEAFRYDLLDRWLFPAGAGMVVRRRAWLECVPDRPQLSGVSGQSLSNKGEDIETLSYLRKAGWQIWHNPDLIIEHHIPSSRFQKAYLLKLCHGVGLSRFATRTVYRPRWQHFLVILAYLMVDSCKLIAYYFKTHKSLNRDVIEQCQFELLRGSIVSPFYHYRKSFNRGKDSVSISQQLSKLRNNNELI